MATDEDERRPYRPRHMRPIENAAVTTRIVVPRQIEVPTVEEEPVSEGSPGEQTSETPMHASADTADVTSAIGAAGSAKSYDDETEEEVSARVGRSAGMMSFIVILSRITGFFRTWGQAFALGNSVVSSCYTVANYLPNMIYELVLGGLIATSFLPVYVSLKRRSGKEASSAYASNLLSLVVLIMGAVCILGFVFAEQVIWTQSFSANEDFDFALSVYLFRWFVIEVVLYALSSVISGVLNAERDYLWSNAAPIFNNVVTTSAFVAYHYVVGSDPNLAVLILAVANPLGVLVQVLLQLPSLKRNGVRLRFHIDLHDPSIRETLSIGVPTLAVIAAATISGSIQASCQLSVTAAGVSVANYAHQWSVLPYSVFAIPISVAMFTELADSVSKGNMVAFKHGVVSGINKICFWCVPFMLYLIVFAVPLITVMGAGSFSADEITMTAEYLAFSSAYVPLYGVYTYLQKSCSALRKMKVFALATVIANTVQIVICLTLSSTLGLNLIALTQPVVYGVTDLVTVIVLRRQVGSLGLRACVGSIVRSFVLGVAGAVVGAVVLWALQTFVGPMGSSVLRAFVYTVAGGIPSLVVTYGLALALKVPEASTITTIVGRFAPCLAKRLTV